jgi:hypothetical protein
MATLFLFSALIGGTLLICQFLMTLVGLGDLGLGAVDHDFSFDHAPPGDAAHAGHAAGAVTDPHHVSWLVGVISFRTLVAAITFFGLGGMVANRSSASLPEQLSCAFLCGAVALFTVHWMMRTFYQLGESGTLSTANAIGNVATVTVSIPGAQSGVGKVLLEVQGRLEELPAITLQLERIPTGCRVVVREIHGQNVLSVEPLEHRVRASV